MIAGGRISHLLPEYFTMLLTMHSVNDNNRTPLSYYNIFRERKYRLINPF